MGGARDLERRLAEARGRATALADALAVMSRAPTDLVAVLETVLDRAANMCDAERASIHLLEADGYHTAAFWGPTSEEYKRLAYDTVRTPGRDTLIGRVALDFPAQVGEVNSEIEPRVSKRAVPDGSEQLLMCEDASGVGDEHGEYLPLDWRQSDQHRSALHLPEPDVDRKTVCIYRDWRMPQRCSAS